MTNKINNHELKFNVELGIEQLKYGKKVNYKIRQFIVINIKLKFLKIFSWNYY